MRFRFRTSESLSGVIAVIGVLIFVFTPLKALGILLLIVFGLLCTGNLLLDAWGMVSGWFTEPEHAPDIPLGTLDLEAQAEEFQKYKDKVHDYMLRSMDRMTQQMQKVGREFDVSTPKILKATIRMLTVEGSRWRRVRVANAAADAVSDYALRLSDIAWTFRQEMDSYIAHTSVWLEQMPVVLLLGFVESTETLRRSTQNFESSVANELPRERSG